MYGQCWIITLYIPSYNGSPEQDRFNVIMYDFPTGILYNMAAGYELLISKAKTSVNSPYLKLSHRPPLYAFLQNTSISVGILYKFPEQYDMKQSFCASDAFVRILFLMISIPVSYLIIVLYLIIASYSTSQSSSWYYLIFCSVIYSWKLASVITLCFICDLATSRFMALPKFSNVSLYIFRESTNCIQISRFSTNSQVYDILAMPLAH